MQRLIILSLTIILVVSVVFGQNNTNATAQSTNKNNTIKPGDNLVVQGIPAIPAELVETVKKYTESSPVFLSDWHPTKREMLVGKRAGNTFQVHLINSPEAAPKQLTSFPEPLGGGAYQRKNGDYFVFSKATGGNEVSQLFRYDISSGKVTRITMDDKKRNGFGPWSNSGEQIAYTAVMTGAQSSTDSFKTELHTINPSKPETDRLVVNFDGVGWSPLGWSPDDKKLIIGQYVSANESYLWLLTFGASES